MKARLRTRLPIAVAGICLCTAAGASALHLRAGNIVVNGDGGFAPTALPEDHVVPIRAFFHGSVRTVDGTRPSPLREVVLEVDRHSRVETRGLPECSKGKLVATTTKQARKQCPGAIIGTGFGKAIVELPEQTPIVVSSPITVFNGPRRNGKPTAIGHAHLDYPAPATYLAQAEIQKAHHGRYGYKIVVHVPRILNGYGSPIYGRLTINRKWTYKGRRMSIANASCADGRLQATARLTFDDGTLLRGTAFKRCTISR
jgi:hypothetical protein